MEKVRLSKNEKEVLRNVSLNVAHWPDGMEAGSLSFALSSLERKGFVRVARASGHEPVAAELTDLGIAYLENNPRLENPVDWKWIASITVGLIAAVAAVAALFIACSSK